MILFLRCCVRNRATLGVIIFFLAIGTFFFLVVLPQVVAGYRIVFILSSGFFWGIFFLALSCPSAGATYLAYKRVTRVLERSGADGWPLEDVHPHSYCNKVGHRMALEDFSKKALRKR